MTRFMEKLNYHGKKYIYYKNPALKLNSLKDLI